MTRSTGQQRADETHACTNLDALDGHLLLAFLDEIPARDSYAEHGTHNPGRGDGVAELTHGKGREGYGKEVDHLIAHRVGVELASHRALHPSVGHENPPSRDGGTQTREPRRGKMEAARHFVPPEEHHSHKRRLHEEGQDAFHGERGSEDVAHEPGVVAPVGAELKLKDNARSHAHGEVDTEEFLPELGSNFPELLVCAIIASLHDAHDDGETERQGHEEPVVDGR